MTQQEQWRAVMARDSRLDGAFVYAVQTTGIYCRPSCPSRRPVRSRVSFFADRAAAERAGFRPCRRCQPQRPVDPKLARIRRACESIASSDERKPTLSELGAAIGTSPAHLQRTFKKVVGISPREYADAQRVGRLKVRLKEGDHVTTALYDAGFGSSSRLYESAAEELGMTPGVYRRDGAGVVIRYTVTSSP